MLALELQMHLGFVPVSSGKAHILFELWLLWASFSSSENAGSWSPREMTLPREGSSVPPLSYPCFPRKSLLMAKVSFWLGTQNSESYVVPRVLA